MPRRDRYEAGRDLFLWVVKITTIAPPPLSPWKTYLHLHRRAAFALPGVSIQPLNTLHEPSTSQALTMFLGSPINQAWMLSSVVSMIRWHASCELKALCGVMITFGRRNSAVDCTTCRRVSIS